MGAMYFANSNIDTKEEWEKRLEAAKVLAAAEGTGVEFLEYDFKKKDGFLKSLKRAKELGLYRQGYCGCEFSKRAR